ncbi:hypothetical protein ACWGDX_25065 [Streptomyces sp. NPDC055025]
MLAAVLHKLRLADQQREAMAMARHGGVPMRESALSKLLSSHPDHYTRLHHLQPYLPPQPPQPLQPPPPPPPPPQPQPQPHIPQSPYPQPPSYPQHR